ncbi:MAG: TrmH family RNA methyltransferase [Patescibacteria group bacterium]
MDNKPQIILVLDNLRSCHNVGSILRTANGFGVRHIEFVGTTPYPELADDLRLAHMISKQSSQIAKTALRAEQDISGHYHNDIAAFLEKQSADRPIVCLEQSEGSVSLPEYQPAGPIYLVVGNEVDGVSAEFMSAADTIVEIPMRGSKESFNVAVSTGIALYSLLG